MSTTLQKCKFVDFFSVKRRKYSSSLTGPIKSNFWQGLRIAFLRFPGEQMKYLNADDDSSTQRSQNDNHYAKFRGFFVLIIMQIGWKRKYSNLRLMDRCHVKKKENISRVWTGHKSREQINGHISPIQTLLNENEPVRDAKMAVF